MFNMPIVDLVTVGVLALVGIAVLGVVIQGALTFFAQRNIADMFNTAIEAILGIESVEDIEEARKEK